MVKADPDGNAEDKPSLKIKLGGKDVSTAGKQGSGATKLKIKLPAAKPELIQPANNEDDEKPVKKEKRTRKRKAPSPDEVLVGTFDCDHDPVWQASGLESSLLCFDPPILDGVRKLRAVHPCGSGDRGHRSR